MSNIPHARGKRKQAEFLRRANALLEELGARVDAATPDRSSINTMAGCLWLTPDAGTGLLTLFGKFDAPDRALALGLVCNQFSGKWNHHYPIGCDLDYILSDLRAKLAGIALPDHSQPFSPAPTFNAAKGE